MNDTEKNKHPNPSIWHGTMFDSWGGDECEHCGYMTKEGEEFLIHGENSDFYLFSICPNCGCEILLDQQIQ